MIDLGKAAPGRFCWVDLAATDGERAAAFYRQMFGWTAFEQPANGGTFTRLRLSGRDVGSIYQLNRLHREEGVLSHWTPYVQVDNLDDAAARAAEYGGHVIVRPFIVSGIARIALIRDSVGAHIGLWEPIEAHKQDNAHG